MNTKPTDKLLTQRQAAELIGVRAETISRWTRRGILPCIRVSRKWLRYERPAVLGLISSSKSARKGAAK